MNRAVRSLNSAVFARARSEGLSAAASRVLAGRLTDAQAVPAALSPKLAHLPPPSLFTDLTPALDRLERAIKDQESIGLLTDYDADGLTSHAVLDAALDRFGVPVDRRSHWIGLRLEEGYGISPLLVDRILESPQRPHLFISADCGSSDEAQIARLKAAGMDVIVTDHHRVSESGPPPSAVAVINPNRADCAYPDKAIAGCLVSWLVMCALRSRLTEVGLLSDTSPKLGDLLDYVALGTVADCVSLGDSEANRAVVNAGLSMMAKQARPCWQVAFDRLIRDPRDLNASFLAFQLAPRLNARGRLDNSMRGFEYLTATHPAIAEAAFLDLDAANTTRRAIEKQMVETAAPIASRQQLHGAPVSVVVLPDGHPGVQGIVASRLVEATGRPAIVLTEGQSPEVLTGSMRSIPGVDAKAMLDAVEADHPGLFLRYGGHVGACGMTLPKHAVGALEASIVGYWLAHHAEHTEGVQRWTDGALLAEDLSIERADELAKLGPFGRGFEEPVFEGVFEVLEARAIGRDGSHCRLRLRLDGREVSAVWFGAQPAGGPLAVTSGQWLDCLYQLTVNTFRGLEVNLIVRHGEPVTEGIEYDR